MQIAMDDTNTWTIKLTGPQNVPFSNTYQKIDTYFGMRVDSDGLSENVLIYLQGATGTEVSILYVLHINLILLIYVCFEA